MKKKNDQRLIFEVFIIVSVLHDSRETTNARDKKKHVC